MDEKLGTVACTIVNGKMVFNSDEDKNKVQALQKSMAKYLINLPEGVSRITEASDSGNSLYLNKTGYIVEVYWQSESGKKGEIRTIHWDTVANNENFDTYSDLHYLNKYVKVLHN